MQKPNILKATRELGPPVEHKCFREANIHVTFFDTNIMREDLLSIVKSEPL